MLQSDRGRFWNQGGFDDLYDADIRALNQQIRDGIIPASERSLRREMLIVDNLLRDYTKGKRLVGNLMEEKG